MQRQSKKDEATSFYFIPVAVRLQKGPRSDVKYAAKAWHLAFEENIHGCL
jgi:hypothetical protein